MLRCAPILFVLAAMPAAAAQPPFLARWCAWEDHSGRIQCPLGLDRTADGAILVADACLHRITRFAPDGSVLASWGTWGSAPGELNQPARAVAGPWNWVYVADAGNHRVQVFSSDGAFLGTWGGEGTDPGRFRAPTGLAVSSGRVWVLDSGNQRVQSFTLTGDWVSAWSVPEPAEGLALREDGMVYVTGSQTGRIDVFTPEGNLEATWTDPPGDLLGGPTGLAWSGDLAWVSRNGTPGITVHTRSGERVDAWGTEGAAPGEMGPVRAIVLIPGGRLYVADANGCIHQFQNAPTPYQPLSWGRIKSRYP